MAVSVTNENRPKIHIIGPFSPNRNVDFYKEAIKVKDLKAKFINEDLQAQFNYLEIPSPLSPKCFIVYELQGKIYMYSLLPITHGNIDFFLFEFPKEDNDSRHGIFCLIPILEPILLLTVYIRTTEIQTGLRNA